MALRKVLEEGNPTLRKISKEVKNVDDHVRMILDDLIETMIKNNGVGLAGPQVGILRRLAVVQLEEGKPYYLINPVIVEQEGDVYDDEGCLSVPDLIGKVHRPAKVKVKSLDRDGNEVFYEGEGMLARAFCHEIEHLDGILYIDKAEDIRRVTADGQEEE